VILTEEQVERLPLLRNEAKQRQFYSPPMVLPWSQVHARSMWEELDRTSVSHDVSEQVEAILWEFEHALTPLLQRMTTAYWNNPIEIQKLLLDSRAGLISPDEFHSRYDRVRDPYVRTLRSVRRLKETTIERIAGTLEGEAADAFRDRARAAAFPRMYPDPRAAHAIFNSVIADTDIDGDSTIAASALFADYRTRYDLVNREMERFYVDWGEQHALNRDGFRTQHLPEALAPFVERREELSLESLQQLAEAVGEDVLLRHGYAEYIAVDEEEEEEEEVAHLLEMPH
jgi:hypothetical protein